MAFAESQMNQHGWRLEELLSYSKPKRVVRAKKVRIGTDSDGGYVMLDDFHVYFHKHILWGFRPMFHGTSPSLLAAFL
jgi:hypothetical protein